MKIQNNENEVNKVINSLQNQNYIGCLLYGSNYGLIQERTNKIILSYLGDDYNSSQIITIQDSDIKQSNTYLLVDLSNNYSLFGSKQVIIFNLSIVGNNRFEYIKNYINHTENQDINNTLLIILADNLTIKSQIRKTCESHNSLITIVNYQDNNRDLLTYINNYLKNNNLTYQGNLSDISQRLGNDRKITAQELNKLKLYVYPKKDITQQEIASSILDNNLLSLNDFFYSFFDKNISKTYKILLSVLPNYQITEIIRALIFHIQKLLTVKVALNNKVPMNKAILLVPNIFFLYQDQFKKHVMQSNITYLNILLNKLFELDLYSRKYNEIINILFKNFVLHYATK